MHRPDFNTGANKLFAFFNKTKSATQATADHWFAEFKHVEAGAWSQAVFYACEHERYMPTIARMKEIIAKLNPKRREREVVDDVELPPEVAEFNAAVLPEYSKFLKLVAARSRSEQAEGFARFMTELYGHACQKGVVGKINWSEFDGIFDFKVPAAWLRTGRDYGQEAIL